jgi:hypothetical protein
MIDFTRRHFLRGAGVGLCLPWLEAKSQKPTVRMAALYFPNGVNAAHWTPEKTGRDFDLPKTLRPLAGLRNRIIVLSHLWNEAAKGGDGHYVKISGWLTSTTVTKTLGVDLNCNGTSMDQIAAKRIAGETPFPSLELGIQPVTTGVDRNVGYTRVYGSHISWGGPTTPLAKETSPRAVFERLFKAGQPRNKRQGTDKLLLDSVLEDAKQLRMELGNADKHRLDEYLGIVRGLEERVERADAGSRKNWKPRVPLSTAPADPMNYGEHVRLMLDMMALAFESNATRIATFMFANEVSGQDFRFVEGVKDSHHELSHHQKDPEKLRQYQLINEWHVEQFAYFLRKLDARKEAGRSVLDHSMVLFGSGIRDGDKHEYRNLPLILAGNAGGRLSTGQHLSLAPDTPLSNLYVSMLDAFGTPVERFADSTRKMTEVLA